MRAILSILGMMALGATLAAQETAPTTETDTRGTKQSMKDAQTDTANAGRDVGHGTATGAKKAGHATKNGTKKAVHKGAAKTDQGASKVEDKTTPRQ